MRAGFVLFASDDSHEGQSDARAYIRAHGFTADDVRLIKRDGQTLVIDKGDAGWRAKHDPKATWWQNA
jgi:hypothetical protein